MKYYCTICRGVIDFGVVKNLSVITEKRCCLCNKQTIVPIPDYETPEQYEKRTGMAYPDNGAVWERLKPIMNAGAVGDWSLIQLGKRCGNDTTTDIVIADPPVPPPDGKNYG